MSAFARPRQSTVRLLDGAVAAWVILWVLVGLGVAREVQELNELAETVELAAGAIEETGNVLNTIADVPFIGGGVAELAERIERTGISARRSAAESRASVRSLSRVLGASVALMPSLLLLALYLPLRLLWRREADAIRRALRRDPRDERLDEYLARRAAATLPYGELRRLTEDPWQDLAERRFRTLADAELARLGIRRTVP